MTGDMKKTAVQWEAEAAEFDKQAANGRREAALQRLRDQGTAQRRAAEIPVDRSAVELTDGSPVPEDRSHTEKRPDGMQKGYVVLTEAERSKGFVRPYRDAYKHLKCGVVTTMGRSLSETYARDPSFYSGTFCTGCKAHFPVGEDGEFTWTLDDAKVGT